MEASGTYQLAATPQNVWTAMTDPEVLQRCIPKCDRVIRHGPTRFEARLKVGFGPLKVGFVIEVMIEDIQGAQSDAPECYRLTAQGHGRFGNASGSARVHMRETEPGATELAYEAEGSADAGLKSFAGKLLSPVARRLGDTFFTRFKDAVENGASASDPWD